MKATMILAIVTILSSLGAVTSFIPIHQASAAPCSVPTLKGFACQPEAGGFGGPQVGNGLGGLHSNINSANQGTDNAYMHTPTNQPCSKDCTYHFQYGIPG